MRVKRKWIGSSLVVLLAGATLATAAAAQDAKISRVELRRCGLYANELVAGGKDSKSPSGTRRVVGNSRLVRETREIPASVGTAFGCEVLLRGAPRGAMAGFVAVLRLPVGAARESFRGPQSFPIGEGGGYVGYTFRNEANLVEGDWNLEIWVNEKKLAEASFAVTK
jgi:hypothetical protein